MEDFGNYICISMILNLLLAWHIDRGCDSVPLVIIVNLIIHFLLYTHDTLPGMHAVNVG